MLGIAKGLKVSIYANSEYTAEQMYQIRRGLLRGIDVSKYADPSISVEQMKQIRLDLVHAKKEE